jgi:hypothetical protein
MHKDRITKSSFASRRCFMAPSEGMLWKSRRFCKQNESKSYLASCRFAVTNVIFAGWDHNHAERLWNFMETRPDLPAVGRLLAKVFLNRFEIVESKGILPPAYF